MTAIDNPKQFGELARGTVEERREAFQLMVDAKLIALVPLPNGGARVNILQPTHPCVVIFDATAGVPIDNRRLH